MGQHLENTPSFVRCTAFRFIAITLGLRGSGFEGSQFQSKQGSFGTIHLVSRTAGMQNSNNLPTKSHSKEEDVETVDWRLLLSPLNSSKRAADVSFFAGAPPTDNVSLHRSMKKWCHSPVVSSLAVISSTLARAAAPRRLISTSLLTNFGSGPHILTWTVSSHAIPF